MANVTVRDMIFGNSYTPRKVMKAYLGTKCIFDRTPWDYEETNKNFDGDSTDQIDDTEIRLFYGNNVYRSWEIEVSFTINAEEDTDYLGLCSCNCNARNTFYNPSVAVDAQHSVRYGNSFIAQVCSASFGGQASDNGYPTILRITHNSTTKAFTFYVKRYYNGQWEEITSPVSTYSVSIGNSSIPLIVGGYYSATPSVEGEFSENNLFEGVLNYFKFRYTSEAVIPWLLNIENYVCDGTATTWAKTAIPIFNEANALRDWEFVINATTDKTAENGTTLGIIGRNANETTGRNCFIEVGIRPAGLYLYRTGILSGLHNQVFPCNCINKDVRVVKEGQSIKFYVENTLINTFTLTRALDDLGVYAYSEIQFGGWHGTGGTYYFNGTINYFRFKFNS